MRYFVQFACSLVIGIAVFGCGGGGAAEGGLQGSVRMDGSSTVYPITEAVAEEFMLEHRGARVTVGVSGTPDVARRIAEFYDAGAERAAA